MNQAYPRFPQMAPSELIPLEFDYTQDLDAGETLSGAISVAYSVGFGTDPSPGAIANGAPAINLAGTKVVVPVKNPRDGVDYVIAVTVPTTNPLKTLTLTGVLPGRA